MTLPTAPVVAMAGFVAVFALASLRRVHLGILMFTAACVAGVFVAGMPLRTVVSGFPIAILVLVAGVTYFFGIAHCNGTIDRVMTTLIARTGGGPVALPIVFFALAAVASAMGSPQAGLVTAPVGMPVARRAGVDSVLMAIAINSGISAGAFAPTSLFGIVTHRVAREAGIGLSPFVLLAVATVANAVLLAVALVLFSRHRRRGPSSPDAASPTAGTTTRTTTGTTLAATGITSAALSSAGAAQPPVRMARQQMATLGCMAALVMSIVVCAVIGVEPDIGVTALGLGALLTLIDPDVGPRAFAKIDWSTALVVGGIVTYVGVLQKLDAVDLLGRAAMTVGTPLVAALLICAIAALVSAFASTTGVLAALVPMAVPLAASGTIAGWALITALGVCATIVDASPFSNTGATLIASAPDEDRARLRTLLLRWGMAMVVLGPLVLVPLLVAIGRL